MSQPVPTTTCLTCGRWPGTPCSTGCPNEQSRLEWERQRQQPTLDPDPEPVEVLSWDVYTVQP